MSISMAICGLRKISFELELSLAFLYGLLLLFSLLILFLQCDINKQGKVQILPVGFNEAVIQDGYSSSTTIDKTNLTIL